MLGFSEKLLHITILGFIGDNVNVENMIIDILLRLACLHKYVHFFSFKVVRMFGKASYNSYPNIVHSGTKVIHKIKV